MTGDDYRKNREFLKDSLRMVTDFSRTDQRRGHPPPPVQKGCDPGATRVKLAGPEQWGDVVRTMGLDRIIQGRKSRRNYTGEPLLYEELSFLLWATQGVRKQVRGTAAYRNVPSAGARHSFETYIFVRNVLGLQPGLYRYLFLSSELVFLKEVEHMSLELSRAALGQKFVGAGAATFVWSCIPYRMEWRYGPTSYRVILMDAGHVCQNLYLACEALGAGTCAVAAYDQEAMDRLLGLDGHDEFAVYLAPVGRARAGDEEDSP